MLRDVWRMKHLYYGAHEYTETKDKPKDKDFIAECGSRGTLFTKTQNGTPAIYQDGVFYKQSRRYRAGETAGKRIHERMRND